MLLGAAVVIALMRDRGDDAGLVVVPAMDRDAGLLADHRTRAIGGDQQSRGQRCAVGQRARSHAPDRAANRVTATGRRSTPSARALSSSAAIIGPFSIICANGSPGCDLAVEGQKGRPHRRRRAWNRSPPCRGSAARPAAIAGQTPMVSNSRARRPPRSPRRAGRRRRGPCAGSASVTDRCAVRALPQRDGQREPGKSAAGDQDIGLCVRFGHCCPAVPTLDLSAVLRACFM